MRGRPRKSDLPAPHDCIHGVPVNRQVICILWEGNKDNPSNSSDSGMCKLAGIKLCDHFESVDVIEVEIPNYTTEVN